MVDLKYPELLAVHAGYRNDPNTGSVAVPLYQTTLSQFNDTQHAENLFAPKEFGKHSYAHHEPNQRCHVGATLICY